MHLIIDKPYLLQVATPKSVQVSPLSSKPMVADTFLYILFRDQLHSIFQAQQLIHSLQPGAITKLPKMLDDVVDPLEPLITSLWIGETSLCQAIDEIKRLLILQNLDDEMVKQKLDAAFNLICSMDIRRTMPSPADIEKLQALLGIKHSFDQLLNNVTQGGLSGNQGINHLESLTKAAPVKTMSWSEALASPHELHQQNYEDTISLSDLRALTKAAPLIHHQSHEETMSSTEVLASPHELHQESYEDNISLSDLRTLTKHALLMHNEAIKGREERIGVCKKNNDVPPPYLEDGLFAVEAIRSKKMRKGKPHYLIKWKGYLDKHNTWEPVTNLYLCQDLIHDFENRNWRFSQKNKKPKHY